MTALRISLWTVLLPVLLIVGCSGGVSNNKGKIEGTKWDNENLHVEFKKDGKLIFDTADGSYTGTYTLGAGDVVTFNFDKELKGQKKHAEKISIDGDRLTLSDTTGTVVLTRIPEQKFEGSIWYNEAGDGKGKFGDIVAHANHLHFHDDGSVEDGGRQMKVGTYVYGPGETLTINFTEKFLNTDWKSKNIPVTDKQYFSMTDVDGNVVKFKRSG